MTAEVGVMNRMGVALAADSAVTIGNAAEKIYVSADKLFQLCECEPIAIMVYGNANFMDAPWETIVKVYRKDISSVSLATVSQYVDHFAQFIESSRKLFPESVQKDNVSRHIESQCWKIQYLFKVKVDEEFKKKPTLKVADIRRIFSSVVSQEYKRLISLPVLSGAPPDFNKRIVSKYGHIYPDYIGKILGQIPRAQRTEKVLDRLITESFLRDDIRNGDYTGVVIAGFGEDEHFPVLVERHFYSVIDDKLLYAERRVVKVGETCHSCIVPFAQAEMVHTFMEGINPALDEMMTVATSEILSGLTDAIVQKVTKKYAAYGKSLKSELKPVVERLTNNLQNNWTEARDRYFTSPVMDNVGSLPKDELAAAAEALVNLTKFKRRISRERETVGGPIDVAVITKGDGFVWVKRKHYFNPDLNPRLMSKYQKQGGKL